MHDPDPPKDQEPTSPAKPGGQALPPDLEVPPEIQDLAAKLDASKRDTPAIASNLHTHEEVAFELKLEDLRFKQEERKAFTLYRRGFAVLLAILAAIALTSMAVAVVGLATGTSSLVLPALAPLSGSGAAGVLLWRSYIDRSQAR